MHVATFLLELRESVMSRFVCWGIRLGQDLPITTALLGTSALGSYGPVTGRALAMSTDT